MQKSKWLEEVYKKFNILSLINYAFRECLDFCFSEKNQKKEKIIEINGPLFCPSVLKTIIK